MAEDLVSVITATLASSSTTAAIVAAAVSCSTAPQATSGELAVGTSVVSCPATIGPVRGLAPTYAMTIGEVTMGESLISSFGRSLDPIWKQNEEKA